MITAKERVEALRKRRTEYEGIRHLLCSIINDEDESEEVKIQAVDLLFRLDSGFDFSIAEWRKANHIEQG